jgi:hypothetical protein
MNTFFLFTQFVLEDTSTISSNKQYKKKQKKKVSKLLRFPNQDSKEI